MNTKKIKEIIKILEESKIDSLKYKDETMEISLSKTNPNVTYQIPSQEVQVEKQVEETEVLDYINAPLVGVFYTRSAPDKEPFVKPGSHINEGDVICIIESMKVMNEIKAPKSGVIDEILIEDGSAVGFDEPLFVLK